MNRKSSTGHSLALLTVLIWGTTFISTKVLLGDFQPLEILLYRFIIGFLALIIIRPKVLKGTNKKQELFFILAGLCGITTYFLLENIALTYTMVSNVGVIVSVSPFFTAIFSRIILKDTQIKKSFFIGFIVSLFGVFLISFNGITNFKISPIGDFLAFGAALVWSLYSILVKKISEFGYDTIQTTKRIFFYGILFMLPLTQLFDFHWNFSRFLLPPNLFNILYLGIGASGLCFITWNLAIKILGTVKTSSYIYLVPVITVLCSVIFLGEQLTVLSIIGMSLTLSGLFISERN